MVSGCKDSACSTWHGSNDVTQEWKELAPPGATICGSGTPDSLRFDMDRGDNAFVKLTEHLESKGFTRTDQDITDPKSMSVTFKKDKLTVSAHIGDSPKGNMSVVVLSRSGG
jgi:hypothetical protein